MENRTLALMLCCTLIFLFIYLEFWDAKQNSVTNVWQIIFSNISVQGVVVHPNIHSFFDSPSHVVPFPAYNFEVLHCCYVATIILMVINWKWMLQMFFTLFTKCSEWLPYVLLITVNPSTTVPIYDTVFAMLSLSFPDTRMFLSVCPSLKCTVIPCLPYMFFRLSHMPST